MSEETQQCPFCDGGHKDSVKGSWYVCLGPERERKDGKPMSIHVSRSNMSHVAEEDVLWLRRVIEEAQGR